VHTVRSVDEQEAAAELGEAATAPERRVARLAPSARPRVGERGVHLHALERAHVFDPVTEAAIA